MSYNLISRKAADSSGQAQTLEAPSPGSYWRLQRDVQSSRDARCITPEMSAGTVLLLTQVDYADGEPHAYRFAGHPMWANADQVKVVFHADDFYEHWERAPDGEAIRAAELAELLQQIEQTKKKLMQDPPEALGVRLLGVDAPDGESGKALATQDSIDAMTAYAHQLQRDAEERTNWIQTNSKKLGEQGTQMARFHSERAQAALARAKLQLDGVKGLLKTADNLRLYVGDGVELVQLLDGAPAASNEPLTIYQELLAFDEETLILLDRGGMDHTHTKELAKALGDTALLNRMIPSPAAWCSVASGRRTRSSSLVRGLPAPWSMHNSTRPHARSSCCSGTGNGCGWSTSRACWRR